MSAPRGMESRRAVLRVARRLFGERGYAAVTIREVAAQAGVSPALVMKIAGSKEQLYALATPAEPAPLLPETPLEGMGELLVRRMLQRRDGDEAEPWLRAMYLLHDAPDLEAARREFRERFLGRFPDEGEGRRVADEIACLLLGLAAGVRSFRLLDPATSDPDRVVVEYGALVQRLIDRLPEEGHAGGHVVSRIEPYSKEGHEDHEAVERDVAARDGRHGACEGGDRGVCL